MSVTPGPVVQVRGWRLVALAETAVEVRGRGAALLARGERRPVAILAAQGERLVAFAPDGSALDPAPLLARHPGLAAALAGG
jgi:hypothetical protein